MTYTAEEAAGLNTHREGPKCLANPYHCGSTISLVHFDWLVLNPPCVWLWQRSLRAGSALLSRSLQKWHWALQSAEFHVFMHGDPFASPQGVSNDVLRRKGIILV